MITAEDRYPSRLEYSFAMDTPKTQTTLNNFRWQTHCRGLYQLPAVAGLLIRLAQIPLPLELSSIFHVENIRNLRILCQ